MNIFLSVLCVLLLGLWMFERLKCYSLIWFYTETHAQEPTEEDIQRCAKLVLIHVIQDIKRFLKGK